MQLDDMVNNLQCRLERNRLSLNQTVIKAFRTVDRAHFVEFSSKIYDDIALPIPENQTISAPHMYAMMYAEEISGVCPGMNVLEIGTGSGYGCALLSKIVYPGKVISIERHQSLHDFAQKNIAKALPNCSNLELLVGDGTELNLPDKFDLIFVTAAGPHVPPSYKEHLSKGGSIIIPLDINDRQWLTVVKYDGDHEILDYKFEVRFVPLLGKYGF